MHGGIRQTYSNFEFRRLPFQTTNRPLVIDGQWAELILEAYRESLAVGGSKLKIADEQPFRWPFAPEERVIGNSLENNPTYKWVNILTEWNRSQLSELVWLKEMHFLLI